MSLNNRELLIRKERGGPAGRPGGFRFGSDREIEGRYRVIERNFQILWIIFISIKVFFVFFSRKSNQTVLNRKYRNEK
jgi:hypothetical protein